MLASRTSWKLTPNEMSLRLDQMRREGAQVLDLTESNPTRCGFRYPSQQLRTPLADPKNMSYDPSPAGLAEARKAVADHYKEKGMLVSPDRIFLTASTSEAYSFLFRLLANAGDHVLAPRPSYPLFDFLATLNDIKLNSYPIHYDAGWHIDLEKLASSIHSQTKAIILVNPNNPTGSFLKMRELSELNQISKRQGLALISDEVFSDYSFVGDSERVSSVATNSPVLTFALGGISKMLGLPQMKLAWIAASGPQNLLEPALERLEVILDTYLSVNTPVQRALTSWLSLRNDIQTEIKERLRANQDFLMKSLANHSCDCLGVEGGWYAILRLPRTKSEEDWVLEFLIREKVYTHPGYFFDFDQEAYIILSLLPPLEIFQEAVTRILTRISQSG